MKTKLSFLAITIITLLGVGILMAFRENVPRKYITIYKVNAAKWYLVGEDNTVHQLTEYSNKQDGDIINTALNEYSNKGYKLTSISWTGQQLPTQVYIIFEKE